MTAAERRATYEDILALPEHVQGQLVAGVLHAHPRPRASHARVSSRLGMTLGGPFDMGSGGGEGGWILLFEPELHLGGDVLVPDLAGWRRTTAYIRSTSPGFSSSTRAIASKVSRRSRSLMASNAVSAACFF